MRLNPIVKKDIKVQSRSMKICWGVFAYDAILALVFFLAMAIIRQEIRYSDGNVYGYVSGQITKDIMKSIIEQTP